MMDSVAAEMSNSRRMYSLTVFDVSRNLLLERRLQGQRVCSPADFGVRKTNLLAKSSDGRGMGFQAVFDVSRNLLLERRPQGQRVRSPADFGVRRTNLLAACSLNGRRIWSLGVMECCEEGIVQMEGGMLEIVDSAQVDKHPFCPRTTFLRGWEALAVHSHLVRLVKTVLNGSDRSQHLYAPVPRFACPRSPTPFTNRA